MCQEKVSGDVLSIFLCGCSSFDLPNIAHDRSLSRFKSCKIVKSS